MKKTLMTLLLLSSLYAAAQYAPAGDKIKTRWASEVTPDKVLPEYPRPLMTRADWQNLNGLWNYAVTAKDAQQPTGYDGEILVPFCIESSLSGVQQTVGADKVLWYRREFRTPKNWKGQRVLLHFGAVDWQADVWVNDVKVGSHSGGYTPFSFDITQALNGAKNTLVVRVWDPTDDSYIPHGKQVNRPRGIFYTAVTGIWQTVWLEPVPDCYIASLKTTPDLEKATVTVTPDFRGPTDDVLCQVEVSYQGAPVAKGKALGGQSVEVSMPEGFLLWTPDHPHLYNMKVTVLRRGKVVDQVGSYFAMRCFGTQRDESGIVRLTLNGKPIFHFGPLDQGWWPDGLYTAPTEG